MFSPRRIPWPALWEPAWSGRFFFRSSLSSFSPAGFGASTFAARGELGFLESKRRSGSVDTSLTISYMQPDSSPGDEVMRILPVIACPFFCGCLAFGYPSFSQTPTIQVDEPDVQAFREVYDRKQSGPFMTGPIEISRTIEKLPAGKQIASQSDAYFPYFCMAFPLVDASHSRSLEIRLYRRGYQTVSIPAVSWLHFTMSEARPQWKKAETLADLEKAIEDISPYSWSLSSGSTQVRQFIAQECLWLAQSEWAAGPEKKEACQRLLDKAKECRTGNSGV
jgi:hypothetical protein